MVETITKKLIIELEPRADKVQKEVSRRAKKEAGEDTKKADIEVEEQIKDTLKDGDVVKDSLQNIGTDVGTMGMLIKNPAGFMTRVLGSNIPILGGIIALAIALPEVVKAITNALTMPGSIFDKRFKRLVHNEHVAIMSREQQQRRRLGLDPLIITTHLGFGNSGGQKTVYSLKEVAERGIYGSYLDIAQGSGH